MRYRLTQSQVKILADGRHLHRNRINIYPSAELVKVCKLAVENGLLDKIDLYYDGKTVSYEWRKQ